MNSQAVVRQGNRGPAGARPRGLVVKVRRSTDGPEIFAPSGWRAFAEISSEEHGLRIVAAGHLYTREARTLAVETSLKQLLPVYVNSGVEAVERAIGGGLFGLVIVDAPRRHVHVLADRLACMPVFYRTSADGVAVAIHQFDIASDLALSAEACIEYLSFGYLPFSASLLEGVERLRPGQRLMIDLDSASVERATNEVLPAYPPLEDRITDLGEACDRLDADFSAYFSRLDDEAVSVGLSGGYDSRLVAAYTASCNRRLMTFGNPGTAEAETARRVAAVLATTTELFDIPPDAPSRFLDDFRRGMQTFDSLESSHVFGNLHALDRNGPQFILDGFLGGETMGSHYFYSLTRGPEPLWKILLVRDRYRQPVREASAYAARLSDAYGRFRPFPGTPDFASVTDEALTRMANEQAECCACDADMLELLSYRIRTRCLIAGGPVTFMRRTPVLCPFYDADVLRTCMSIDKSLRAGERLYNAFWRRRFPELAGIPKESTGGRPSTGDIRYRLAHFRHAAWRRALRRLPVLRPIAGRAGGDTEDFQRSYWTCEANQELLELPWSNEARQCFPDKVADLIEAHREVITLDPTARLRAASLAVLAMTERGDP